MAKKKKKSQHDRYRHIVQAQTEAGGMTPVTSMPASDTPVVPRRNWKAAAEAPEAFDSHRMKHELIKVGGFVAFTTVVYAAIYYIVNFTPYLSSITKPF